MFNIFWLMDEISQLSNNNNKVRNYHFNAISYLDKETTKPRHYHNFPPSKEYEDEYQKMTNENKDKKDKAFISLTDEDLKKEYFNIFSYLNGGFKYICVISVLSVLNSLFELKYFDKSDMNIGVLIISCISSGFCFILYVNIHYFKALLDSYSYLAFYSLCLIESLLYAFLFIFKIFNFVSLFQTLNTGCSRKRKCPRYFAYLLILVINLIIFLGFVLSIKLMAILFWKSFKIVCLKSKTIFQKQIELNKAEKNKGKQIEFTDDTEESINNSLNELHQINSTSLFERKN